MSSAHPSSSCASGFSLVEFLLVSVPVLLLTLGGIEVAHWFHVRQVVGLALVEAARSGATQHAQPAAIAQAFEQALRPLFAGHNPEATDVRLAFALQKRSHAMAGAPPWQIRILRPDARDYAQLQDPTLAIARANGLAAIRNDYQAEQQQRVNSSNNAIEHGGTTVFAANTLALRLSYPHPPLFPGVVRLMASLSIHTDDYARRALAAGLLPMIREVRLDMASHPVDWPSLPDGRVIKADTADTSVNAPERVPTPCIGLWCQPKTPRPLSPSASKPIEEVSGLPAWESGLVRSPEDDDNAEDAALVDDPECPAGCC